MKPKEIAPRLLSGDSRQRGHRAFPESINDGLRAIARREGRSVNWVLERVVIEYFDLPRPRYKPRKDKDLNV